MPSLAAYILNKPTLAIVQNNVKHSLADYSNESWLRYIRWSYARTIAVVCVSHDLIPVLKELGVREGRLLTIPNAVNVVRIRALAAQPPPSLYRDVYSPIMVGIGRLTNQKGFDLLIRAHAEVLQLGLSHKLILIGEGPERSNLNALASELGISDSVLFLGYVPNPYPAIAHSSVCCMSSRYEGRSLVLSEAALLGTPIIATDCPTGPREILADGKYGDIVETESVKALSKAIKNHFQFPQRLIAKAQAAARDPNRYSIENCAQEYLNLIRQHFK